MFLPRLNRVRLIVLSAAALPFLGASAALADSVVYNYNSVEASTSLTDWSTNFNVQEFDPSLGTLNSVTLTVSVPYDTTLTMTNSAAGASSGNDRTEIQVTVTDPDSLFADGNPIADVLSQRYYYTLGSGQSVTSPTFSSTGSGSIASTAAAVLAEFTGTGALSLSAGSFTQTLLANTGGNTGSDQVTHAGLDATVTYNYTVPSDLSAVPAPAVFPASLIAVAGGWILIRRRQPAAR